MKYSGSVSIWINDAQFKNFIKSMPSIGLKRKPEDKSTFPLDFVVYYDDRFKLNFEYLSGNLEFYLISDKDSKTGKTIKNDKSILSEIKKKIENAIKNNPHSYFKDLKHFLWKGD